MQRVCEPSARAFGQRARAFIYAATACTLLPCSLGAYELRQTSGGAFVRWESEQVPFVVDRSLEAAAPGGVDAAVRAVGSWSRARGGPSLVARVTTGATEPAADGQNTILYMPGGYPPARGALAITISTVEPETGELLDTDIVINGTHAFAVLSQNARPAAGSEPVATEGAFAERAALSAVPFDLEHVIAHEVGHALGLADVHDATSAVMYAYTWAGDASNREPSRDDVAGLESLYAGASERGGCSASSTGGRLPTGATAFLGALSIAAVLVVGRGRARGIGAGARRWAR